MYENEIISTDVENTLSAVSEREVEKVLTPAKPRGRTKKAVPQKSISDTENSDGEQDEPQVEKPRKRANQTNGKKKGQERIDIQIEMVAVSRREHAMLRVDPYLIVHPQPAPSLTTGSTTPPLSTQTQ